MSERKPPRGDLYLQHEYRTDERLADALSARLLAFVEVSA